MSQFWSIIFTLQNCWSRWSTKIWSSLKYSEIYCCCSASYSHSRQATTKETAFQLVTKWNIGEPFQIFRLKFSVLWGTQTVATHLFSCEALTDDLSVLVDVKVLPVASITVSHPSLLHCKYKHNSSGMRSKIQ